MALTRSDRPCCLVVRDWIAVARLCLAVIRLNDSIVKPASKTVPEMGPCPHCGGTIGYAGTQCSKRVAMPTCDDCGSILDRTYCRSYAFVHAQSERRKRKWSPAKELLRRSQLTTPVFIRSRCWTIYSIGGAFDVRYCSATDTYDILDRDNPVASGFTIDELIDWVQHSGFADDPTLQYGG